jgi:predicted ABC-type ATPase
MLHSTGNKELIIIGGPNGSGKTTLARELLKENEYEYVSADDIAYELNPDDPLAARLEAGKEFFKRLDRFANDGTNLLIESTLSGKSLLNVIAKFQKELGYTVSIVFIFLDSEDICIERIQTRVKKGGHPVPEKDVVRRFGRSIVNFWNEYRLLCERWVLYYNTEDSFQEVAHHQEDEIYVYDEPLFVTFKDMVNHYG